MSDSRRYVLFKSGGDSRGDIAKLRETLPGIRIVESVGDKGFLVEATSDVLGELKRLLPEWAVEEERIHPLPKTRFEEP